MNIYLWSAILGGIATCLLLYLDSRLFDEPKAKIIYFKSFIGGALLVSVTTYIVSLIFGSGGGVQMGGGQTGNIIQDYAIGQEYMASGF